MHTGRPNSGHVRVALDATPLLGARTGVGRFCEGALRSLGAASRDVVDVSAFAVTWRRRHLLPPLVPRGVAVHQRAMPARPLHLAWGLVDWPPAEWFVGSVDVVHGTNFVVPPTRRAARVVTVHDLTALRLPELCDRSSLGFPALVRRAVRQGAWVHTPSHFVAREVVGEFGAHPSKVRVVYHGVTDVPGVPGTPDAAHGPDEPDVPDVPTVTEAAPASSELPGGTSRYIVAVGTIEPRKDYPGLVRAFSAVAGAHPDVALIVIGQDGWGASAYHDAVATSPFRERIRRLGFVTDDALAQWIGHAALLAFPSLYEGFGFPPLEAMVRGVPVVATRAGAVPEIVVDGALLVEPGQPDELAGALERVLSDDALRGDLVSKGRCRAARFTWEACGAGLTELYLEAAGER